MSDTLPDIPLTNTPQALSALSAGAIPAGSASRFQNKGHIEVQYARSVTIPDKSGSNFAEISNYGSWIETASGESDVWLWVNAGEGLINAELAE